MCTAGAALAQSFPAGEDLDRAIEQAIREKKIPGAVLVVGHKGKVVYRQAYGSRALYPSPEPMTVDTIFDCASLTKVIATTPAIMKLFEQGKLRIRDKVTEYLPEFQDGKSEITIADLMTHFSGLRPDLDLDPPWTGYETGIQKALHEKPVSGPGVKFVYSDINFILVGEIVRRLGGEPEPEFLRRTVYEPLGMNDTMFNPPAVLRPRIAPTERMKTGEILRGVVHDPTARDMGGVAGHAGLFSTAGDLARFCQMMLDHGAPIFSPLTVSKFTSAATPPNQPVIRGLGWDISSPLSGNRGELFPVGTSYGHTGFTGTSIWIDPASETYVILLTNAVHPTVGKPVTPLRGNVATIVAAAVGRERPDSTPVIQVYTGLDVLAARKFDVLQGKRVGLITNHTGIDRDHNRNIDLMLKAGVKLTALFSPEHGFLGAEDQPDVDNTRDPTTGIRVWSLYQGKNRRPTPEMLRGLDALVFDIADVGARFYTYVSTMAYAMEEAAKAHVAFYVLDRPNPITGLHVEGPMLEAGETSFVGYFPMPLRHGMTMGELATMFNRENRMGAELHVAEMRGWRRSDWFDATGLPWVDPSPNIRSLSAALLYPGIAMLEYSPNYSVGRGTEAPFEQIGADFLQGRALADALDARAIPGVRAYSVRFEPSSSHFAGKHIEGVRFVVTNRDVFDAGRLGTEISAELQKRYPGKIDFSLNRKLIGSPMLIQGLERGDSAEALLKLRNEGLERFLEMRGKYLLYR